MTDLTKDVSRRVTLLLDNRLSARNRDRITVSLHPDNTIGFRAYKCRHEVRLPLSVAYKIALKEEARVAIIEKQKQAKLEGRRIRKPRRSSLLFL